MTTAQIHAAVLHGIGQTPRYERFPAPVAGDDQAIVTVTAAALKPSDRLMANGVHYAPTTFPQSWAWTAWAGWRTALGWHSCLPWRPTAGWPSRRWYAAACGFRFPTASTT